MYILSSSGLQRFPLEGLAESVSHYGFFTDIPVISGTISVLAGIWSLTIEFWNAVVKLFCIY